MSVDKFGRFWRHSRRQQQQQPVRRGPPGIGFRLTPQNNDFDLQFKRLTNVKEAIDKFDATTKNYVDNENLKLTEKLNTINKIIAVLELFYTKRKKGKNINKKKIEIIGSDRNGDDDDDHKNIDTNKTFKKNGEDVNSSSSSNIIITNSTATDAGE